MLFSLLFIIVSIQSVNNAYFIVLLYVDMTNVKLNLILLSVFNEIPSFFSYDHLSLQCTSLYLTCPTMQLKLDT